MAKVLYVGSLGAGSTSRMRCEALRSLGYAVIEFATDRPPPGLLFNYTDKFARRLRLPLDIAGVNRFLNELREFPDILWIDKGNTVYPSTLQRLRQRAPGLTIIGYSPDDMMQASCSSVYFMQGLRWYDAFITTKSFGVAELLGQGCPRVVFSENAYDPATHRPHFLANGRPLEHTIPVGFIGHHERERCHSIAAICEAGIPVTVTGPGWQRHRRSLPPNATVMPPVYGDDYAIRICHTIVNLGFLRRLCRDVQTQRSVEIPACGGFLLASRTEEHSNLFTEGVEADYFSNDDELIEKTGKYVADSQRARSIGDAALQRCRAGRYSYAERLQDAIEEIGLKEPGPR